MKVALGPDIEIKLRQALRQAGRREIGGMLFAEQLVPGHFRIADISMDVRSGSGTHFHRDPAAHQQALNDFFERTGNDFQKFNYLGEWHSHPSFPISPSLKDVETMQSIVEDQSGRISFALLLIVKLQFRFWMDYSLTVFTRACLPRRTRLAPRII